MRLVTQTYYLYNHRHIRLTKISLGHCCMCRWCAAQHLGERHPGDRTRLVDRRKTCPVCRKGVKQIVSSFLRRDYQEGAPDSDLDYKVEIYTC